MKFDHIIMNPPYCRNLHLKILNEAICYSDDIVNLSPIRWLQDPLAEYKKNSDWKKFEDIRKKIKSLEVIPSSISNALFSINTGDLGIYSINCHSDSTTHTRVVHPIILKVLNKLNQSVMDVSSEEGYRGAYTGIFGIINSHYGDVTKLVSNDYELFCKQRYTNVNKVIFFNTEAERLSMFNYLNSKLMRMYAKLVRVNQRVPWQFVPNMPTYTHPWTDEMLYKYFELTPEEIQAIENEFKDEI